MKIAIYYDLPFGGASVAMSEIISLLSKKHIIEEFHNISPSINSLPPERLQKDFESIVLQYFKQRKQAKIINNQSYDLVFVCHDRHFQAPWILRFLNKPTVFLCQEPTRAFFEKFLDVDPNLPLLNRFYERLNRLIRKNIEIKNASYATRIISNSSFSRASIKKAYGKDSTPIYMGVNTNNFYKETLKIKNQVVVVGNNEPQKNLSLAILSVGNIDKFVRPSLVIVSPRSRLKKDIIDLADKNKVSLEIKETIDTSEVRKIYNESICLLAVAKLEPFGLSVVESLACGTPVVAINDGGFRETVIDKDTGFLVEDRKEAIAIAIIKLIKNKNLREKMGKQGIEDVHKRFLWPGIVKKIEKVFYETA
jgi:glycosyltransferase involved in cell wall biosynthesis